MNSLYTMILIFIISSCNNNSEEQHPKSDSSKSIILADTTNLLQPDNSLILVSSAQMSPYETINIGDINFQLVKNSNGDTSFFGTRDKSFVTPEGYNVGMSLLQIKEVYRDSLEEEPGWGYYIKLPSEWNLQFIIGQTATEHFPVDTSKVTYIFKRR